MLPLKGPVSKLDWMQNFTFWKKPYRNMDALFFVHRGIFKKYESVKDELWEYIKEAGAYDYVYRGYGFSQGGTIVGYFHEDSVYRGRLIKSYAFARLKGLGYGMGSCYRKD
jgi:hypothetical protein